MLPLTFVSILILLLPHVFVVSVPNISADGNNLTLAIESDGTIRVEKGNVIIDLLNELHEIRAIVAEQAATITSLSASLNALEGGAVFSKSYTSPQMQIVLSTIVTLNPGFGMPPKLIVLELVNVVAEFGYRPGEVSLFPPNREGGFSVGVTVSITSTNEILVITGGGGARVGHITIPGPWEGITKENWNVRVRAYA
jgi:hypothetical protein